MRGEILGFERRRRWSDEEKIRVVMSVGIDGASVTQVAQRYEVTRQQVYAWRHDLKKKGLWSSDNGSLFIPMDVPFSPGIPAVPDLARDVAVRTQVELRLQGGRCLHFDSTIDAAQLTQLIRAVEIV